MSELKLVKSDGNLEVICGNDISEYEGYNIPILYLNGAIGSMSKEETATLNYIFEERSGTCTLKWQGSSSLHKEKKNYTIKFDNAFEVVEGWGEQKKYCLKANYIDYSHARNIVSAKLWGQIVKKRSTRNTNLYSLPNGGAIDGFPIIISLNGKFHGLYTWNIPKDGWMFGMSGSEQQQAIICADLHCDAIKFKALATFENDYELEYSSDDTSEWVLESVNRLIGAVMNSDGTNITYGITPYLDWDSAIDYLIHTVLINGSDNMVKNFILFTHDGIKWGWSAYDMDAVFGNHWDGKSVTSAITSATFATFVYYNKLMELIWTYKRPELRARYKELRNTVMSEDNVAMTFCNFVANIPKPILDADAKLYKRIPSTSVNNLDQILNHYRMRVKVCDDLIENTEGELELPEQVNPSIPTLVSISATYNGGNVAIETSLADLTGIVVTGTYSDGSTSNITGYSLSGEILEGDNTITVIYNGLSTTFTVVGVKTVSYTNQIPISIDTDGSIFNGKGYIENTRLSSSGVAKEGAKVYTTGYIPASKNAVVRIAGVEWYNVQQGANYVCAYDKNFGFISAVNSTGYYNGGTVTGNANLTTVTLLDNENIAYIRVSIHKNNTEVAGEDLIVTVNEPIE